jgi:hypothetical protein
MEDQASLNAWQAGLSNSNPNCVLKPFELNASVTGDWQMKKSATFVLTGPAGSL